MSDTGFHLVCAAAFMRASITLNISTASSVQTSCGKVITCVARSTESCLWQAVVFIYGVAKVTHLQDWLSVMSFEQDVFELDVSVCHAHSAHRQRAGVTDQPEFRQLENSQPSITCACSRQRA